MLPPLSGDKKRGTWGAPFLFSESRKSDTEECGDLDKPPGAMRRM